MMCGVLLLLYYLAGTAIIIISRVLLLMAPASSFLILLYENVVLNNVGLNNEILLHAIKSSFGRQGQSVRLAMKELKAP